MIKGWLRAGPAPPLASLIATGSKPKPQRHFTMRFSRVAARHGALQGRPAALPLFEHCTTHTPSHTTGLHTPLAVKTKCSKNCSMNFSDAFNSLEIFLECLCRPDVGSTALEVDFEGIW